MCVKPLNAHSASTRGAHIVDTLALSGAATQIPNIGDTLTFKGLPLLVARVSSVMARMRWI